MINEILNNEELIKMVISDLMGVTKYMNVGILIALAYGAVYLFYVIGCKFLKKDRKLSTGHAIAVFALLIYLTSILFIVFVSREPGQFEGVNLELWSSWGKTTLWRAMFIENIIMFIPMGILLPGAFRKFRNPLICVITCVALSIIIETVQYIFKLGIFELDDVVTNTLGGGIGWLIWAVLWLVYLGIGKIFSNSRKEKDK
ncbi:VanZ family protein [Butyrivibrio sp. VCD2006]|uniref:VanZ family protein n=1 Tax=Butyrivibrio sp. VCD2006 TaxID=1280664 RepID=UPI000421BE31|nr:VanZ family protein [Butyrivibrio sp. VCD2006]